MCGIFALLNYEQKYSSEFIQTQFQKGKARGPEDSIIYKVGHKITFGFHRLAINGLNAESNQPLVKGDLTLICNGEIYNYKELYELMGSDVMPNTQSDCEVILWLYEKYGIEQTLQMIDGVFAFALLDQRHHLDVPTLYVARDPYGVRPLYTMTLCLQNSFSPDNHPIPTFVPLSGIVPIEQTSGYYNGGYRHCNESTIGFASELKMLSDFSNHCSAKQFPPGTYSKYVFSDKVCSEWALAEKNTVYHRTAFSATTIYPKPDIESYAKNIQKYLIDAVQKRCLATERPVACLLSGGLDSSLITALVNDFYTSKDPNYKLETYSIGLKDSVDLKFARMVADHLGTNHTEIILTEQDFCNAIPEVIQAIESYDTTTVRASIGNYLLGKYIAKNSEAKVIFNGDGSDELMGGYLYLKNAPDAIEFDRECRRLLRDIHSFDVLRSDKCISSHGLEPRTPFLDRAWTQYYLSISPFIRFLSQFGTIPERGTNVGIGRLSCRNNGPTVYSTEKYLVRIAFSRTHFRDSKCRELLPQEVLWRRKEAFSDGVSGYERSLYQVLQEYCEKEVPLNGYKTYEEMGRKHPSMAKVKTNHPKTAEQFYYRSIFEHFYSGYGEVIPYFWMPKYVEAEDASARTLDLYTGTITERVTSVVIG
jgi:asparagine synthase (glutamine-hydrolysing)